MQLNKNLNRFLDAQETSYDRAFEELKGGKKRTHWMWYIFPQIQGLGFSATAKFYSINDMDEAQQYLDHNILGQRLIRISKLLLTLSGNDPYQIFGNPDNMKLQSSMTLFASLNKTDPVFKLVLQKFFQGKEDIQTLKLIDKN